MNKSTRLAFYPGGFVFARARIAKRHVRAEKLKTLASRKAPAIARH